MAILQVNQRSGAASSWTSSNPILQIGEIGYEVDTGFFKIGDNATVWNSLPYWGYFGGDVQITGGTPRLRFNETDGTVNNRIWDFRVDADQLIGRVLADDELSSTTWLAIDRTLNVVDSVVTTSTTWTFNSTNVTVSDILPSFVLTETDQALDQKTWSVSASTALLVSQVVSDDLANAYTYMQVARSGTGAGVQADTVDFFAATDVTINAPTFDVQGNITLTGTVDGIDIAARDHDAVTFAGTGTYISLAGQVITVDPITESDIADLKIYKLEDEANIDAFLFMGA